MFDAFDILSGGVFLAHEFRRQEDWMLERPAQDAGTAVFLRLDNDTPRTTREVFDQFTGGEDEPVFNKTVVPVRLAQYGNDRLISRSQAKRVLARIDLFSTVLLDFEGVPTIGRAFADEVFRVFRRDHPDVSIVPVNDNPEVKRMIARAWSAWKRDPVTASRFFRGQETGRISTTSNRRGKVRFPPTARRSGSRYPGRSMTAREACHGASLEKADAAASHGGPLADDHSQESRQLDVVPDGPPSPGAVPHSWLAESSMVERSSSLRLRRLRWPSTRVAAARRARRVDWPVYLGAGSSQYSR